MIWRPVIQYITAAMTLTHWDRDQMTAVSQTTFLKRIFLNENVQISIKISLKFVPKGPINPYPLGLLHCHGVNLTIPPMPVK